MSETESVSGKESELFFRISGLSATSFESASSLIAEADSVRFEFETCSSSSRLATLLLTSFCRSSSDSGSK